MLERFNKDISSSKMAFRIYSKSNCTFCDKSLALIELDLNVPKDQIRIIKDADQDIIEGLKKEYEHKTYPFIFFDNEFIGGYTELIHNIDRIIECLRTNYGIEQDEEF